MIESDKDEEVECPLPHLTFLETSLCGLVRERFQAERLADVGSGDKSHEGMGLIPQNPRRERSFWKCEAGSYSRLIDLCITQL